MARILVIEDEAAILENIVETLELEDFEVFGAINGQKGIHMARQYQPDLILCDIMMPEISGYDVLMTLRGDPELTLVPFIFLTALATRSAMRQGMELGADDYLTKPFTPLELISAVTTRLEKHQIMMEMKQQEMDRLRNNIVYALPHELRTPLMGIMGCADLLLEDYEQVDRETVHQLAEVMVSSTQRLQHLVENYLQYAQIEILRTDPEKVVALRHITLDTPATVIASSAMQQATAMARDNDMVVEVVDSCIQIDVGNLTKITSELVNNALKFSEPGTPVYVKAAPNYTTYDLVIADQGRGMTVEEIEHIGAYTQFNRALFEQQGVGLGLSIARRLVELHGGEMDITSQPDRGTTIVTRLVLSG